MSNSWHWYDLGFSDAPYYLGVNLGFFQDQLRTVMFGWALGSQPKSWDDWSEAAQLRQAQEYEKWLTQ
jgi:hypothetical protein